MPVSSDARLAALIGVVTKALRKQTPSRASESMCGVRTIGLTYPTASHRWSSVRMKRMLGRCAEGGLLRLRGTCGQQRAGAGCQPVQKGGLYRSSAGVSKSGCHFSPRARRKAASLRTARPRCDTAFFSSGDISAKVRSQPSGTKSGS